MVVRMRKPAQVFQIKVVLRGSRPPIWRRIHVRSDITLAKLHDILQVVMGWTDSHLHQFVIGREYYGVPDEEEFGFTETLSERKYRLGDLVPGEKARFGYDYDFGDGWAHSLLVEKVLPLQESLSLPRCLAGARACPPEDVGGIWGYQEFLETIRDPSRPEHNERLDWIGGSFDPERFDLDEVNEILRQLK